MATAIANIEEQPARQLAPADKVRNDLSKMADQLKMALPSHVSVEKFQRVTMTAIQTDPDLLAADRRSLFGAITRAAQDGLLPDKREGALVIFTNKVKGKNGEQDQWIKAVQWMPMVAGILKKVRQSGEISGISAHVVYEADDFVHRLGDDESIEHNPPTLGTPRGKPVGAYAVATLKDGFKIREVMDLAQIERVRAVSKTGQYGPWKDWWDEMARKTVIRRLSKRLPMSTDIEAVINDPSTDAAFAEGSAAVMSSPQPLTAAALLGQSDDRPNDGTLALANPAASEGMGDEDRGERTDADDIANLYHNATTPADLTAADMAANKLGLSEDLTVANAKSDAETRIDA
jgi:recombination protein RecT